MSDLGPAPKGEAPRYVGDVNGKPRYRGSWGFEQYRNLGLETPQELLLTPLRSANQEVMQNRERGLRNAADAERNSEMVRGGLDRKANAVVGPNLRAQPNPDITWLNQQTDWLLDYQLSASSVFEEWGSDPFCRMDGEGHYNFGGLMWQGFRDFAGPHSEITGYIGYDRDRADQLGYKFGTFVHLFDPSRLSNPGMMGDGDHRVRSENLRVTGTQPITEDGILRLRGGREVDERGAMRAMYCSVRHPAEPGSEPMRWERIPRYTEMDRPVGFHFFIKRRPGMQRAMTTLAAVLSLVNSLSTFKRATLETAVSHSMLSAYVKTTMTPEQTAAHLRPQEEYADEDGRPRSEWDLKADVYDQMRPIVFRGKRLPVLGPNDEIVFEGLEGAAMDFDPFVNAFLRELASALNISFEQLSLDFSRSSYSSTRSSILEAWRQISFERELFTRHVASLVYNAVIEEAFVMGILKAPAGAPGFYQARQAYTRVDWTGPGMGWVDPKKEIEAAGLRTDSFVSNLPDEAAGQGTVWSENIRRAAMVEAYAKKMGVTTKAAAAQAAIDAQKDAAASEEEDDEDVDDNGQRESENA